MFPHETLPDFILQKFNLVIFISDSEEFKTGMCGQGHLRNDNTFALARSDLISWNGFLGEENTFPGELASQ